MLNLRNGSTVTEVAKMAGLPRTTAYRVLETLADQELVERETSNERYWLTIKVRELSDGFDDEAWVKELSTPHMDELGKSLVWPVTLATIMGTSMYIRQNTDHQSPLAVERYALGFRLPMFGSASGRVYLAFCSDEQREAILDMLANSGGTERKYATNRYLVDKILSEVRQNGYAVYRRDRQPLNEETIIATPIFMNGRIMAALAVRFMSSAVTDGQAAEKFIPQLKATADKISDALSSGTPPHQAQSES